MNTALRVDSHNAQLMTAVIPAHADALKQLLFQGLDLLQGVQQHRGLGGQTSSDARQRCQALGNNVDRRWTHWPYAGQQTAWQQLRAQPTDFEGHCRLLQEILGALQQLELHRCALTLYPPLIAERCWQLEDLGLLRGLSVRASAHARCPLDMLIPLKYLHQRLSDQASGELREALERLRRGLLCANAVSITPQECFALLTPLIDERLDGIRRDLN